MSAKITSPEELKKLRDRAQAQVSLRDGPKEVQAVVHGWLTLEYDRERIDRYWNAVVAAWYPDGKDDPSLTLLRLDCEQAEVWISEAGPIRFAWEIARANATGERPDLGGRKSLDFH